MRMSAAELGGNLAHLVWESFSDFLDRRSMLPGEQEEQAGATAVLAAPSVDPVETLIFFMWLHTRACQQAAGDRPETVREVLDQMHQALYEDLEAHAIPRVQLPLFEQRISARYTEYYEAGSHESDEHVVEVAARRVLGETMSGRPAVVLELAEAATVTGGPLRDFLRDVSID